MTEDRHKLAEELNGIDFKELALQGTEIFVPNELIVGLARGKLTFRELLGVTPESIQNVTRYGYRLLEHGYNEAAAMIFDTLASLDPKIAYFRLGLGAALAGLGKKQAAKQAFEAARALDEKELSAQYNLAVLLLEEGDTQAASSYLAEARAIDPGGHHPMATMIRRLWLTHFEPA